MQHYHSAYHSLGCIGLLQKHLLMPTYERYYDIAVTIAAAKLATKRQIRYHTAMSLGLTQSLFRN